jgi:predicted Zn-dependent peptidase
MRSIAFASVIALVACGGAEASAPPHLDLPVPPMRTSGATQGNKNREPPPGSLASKPSPFPAIARGKLDTGLRVAVAESHALPIVQIRVVTFAGMGYGTPAAADLTAEMLKEGGTRAMTSATVLAKIESLGASLSVDVDFDRSVLSVGVTKAHLDEAMSLLGQIVTEPRFDGAELRKLKARRTDEAREAARGSGAWSATRVMFRELYAEQNPYSHYDMVPSEIAKVTEATLRDFHKKFWVPSNMEVIVTGDVTLAQAQSATQKAFGAFKGAAPPKVEFPEAIAPAKRRVIIASRPQSEQSDIFVASLAPARNTPDWPDLRVANQILGGGVASRLFADVREQRSLAYSTRSQILELSHGREPLYAYAGTATKKTGLAVQGLLDNLQKISTGSIDQAEVSSAGRYLSDIFAIRLESIGSIADLVAVQDTLSLPDGYWDTYRSAVREVMPQRAEAAAKKLYAGSTQLIVVAGDASVIGKPLSRFGEVVVLDPEKEFATVSTIPADPNAALE